MLWALLLSLSMAAPAVTGVVKDSTGGAVPGASVTVQTVSGLQEQAVTGPDGRFSLETSPTSGATLVVRATGFAEKRQAFTGDGDIEITLQPARVLETVSVTPTRSEQRLGDLPVSVSVLDAEQIKQSPAVVADDILRQVPTFSLFRRTSSLSSHPTAQGVSLRGIGPSGVSRTLVMLDNVPFNDPFGGWVYWTRVPTDNIDRIEVVEGPSSSLYGNYGMGGVINIVSSRATKQTVEFKPQYGNLDTRKADFFGSNVWNKLGASLNGSFFDTDGYPIVIANERGAVDQRTVDGKVEDNTARVNFRNLNAKVDYTFNNRVSAFFRAGYFREQRDNAKASTVDGTEEANDTTWKSTATGVRVLLPDSSDLQARVFTDYEEFNSNFLAVPAATPLRSFGRISLNQSVPSRSVGGMVQWARAFGMRNLVTAGTDWRWVDGDSQETSMDAQLGQIPTLYRVSGGTQKSLGVFVQDVINPTDKLMVTLSARVDHWRNYDAHNLETLPSGQPGAGNKPTLLDKEDTVGSPKVAALYHLTDRVSAWGSMSWGFRAPTLNELYRQYRVGAVLTLANEELGPERLKGGEIGANFTLTDDLTVRTVWFDNRIKNPVSNVTIANNTQQRQNLGRTKVTGIQTDAEYRLNDEWRISGGYLFNQAKVTEFSASPDIVGNFLPQVPQNRGSFRVAYMNPKIATLALGAQFLGRQFDDDQNVQVVPGFTEPGLPKYAVWDFTASRAVTPNVEAFFGAQNLANSQYYVGTRPTTIGSPRMVNVGVRIKFAAR